MSLTFFKDWRNNQSVAVTQENPLPTELVERSGLYLPPVAGQTITRIVQVPGIGTGAAYTAGDAFGTLITFNDVFRTEKRSGIVVGAFLIDLDDEGLQVDVPLYVRPITVTADNSAAAPSDIDMLACRGFLSVSSFLNLGSNQFGKSLDQPFWIAGEGVNLYSQLIAQGGINIAAGAEPWIALVVVPD